MAGITFDTTELVTTLKDRGLVPTNQALFNTASFLRSCTQEMWGEMVVDLLRVRNQYLTWTEDQTIVASQSDYRIPHRAVGGKLEAVVLVTSSGQETPLDLISPQDVPYLSITGNGGVGPSKYYIENHSVVLWPAPGSSVSGETLRMRYPIRPNALVPTTEAYKVTSTSVNGSNTRLVGTVPTTFASGTYDIIAGRPGFQHLAISLTSTAVVTGASGYVEVATTGIPTKSRAITTSIDWVCAAGDSPVPQIPAELHGPLAVLGLAAHLDAIGDHEGADRARKTGMTKAEKGLILISPRVNGQVKKVVNRSWLRGRR